MKPQPIIMALAIFLALSVVLQPVLTLAYGPWLLWLTAAIWLGWWVPGTVAPTARPMVDAGRRFALGSVAVTLMSVPVVYVIATLQASIFGEAGLAWEFRWAEARVVAATIMFLAPSLYVPLLVARCGLLYWREQGVNQ